MLFKQTGSQHSLSGVELNVDTGTENACHMWGGRGEGGGH